MKLPRYERGNALNSIRVPDPMRNSNLPDILGQFIDPMGGRATYTQGIDPTNTVA
ncbi:hypothetical protein INT45_001642 [Circinella minor]|uniref:Uncharacterized protein n=1 Tax=Circinella minor TaxID=1195481 RepID=A0A8H7S7I1_9FUNG|nr:hypothetical protein INT45_001642 [Circinella minor]